MLPRRIAGRYAEALFGLAQQKNTTAAWEQELKAIATVVETSPDLHAVLTHPEIPLVKKESVLNKTFQGKISPEVLAVLFMLIKRGHDPDLQVLHDIYVERWNAVRRIVPVTVTSALPLSESQVAALNSALTKRTGATVELAQAVDKELIAGMVVKIGDRVIDASARATLESLRASMAGV